MQKIAIYAESADLTLKAKKLAKRLSLPMAAVMDEKEYDYFLLVTKNFLGLKKAHEKSAPLVIDFLSPKMIYRAHNASLRREAIARALGLKNKSPKKIVDATGGLLRDSFILAVLGFDVTVFERSPIIYELACDGLLRAQTDAKMKIITTRIHLIQTDAVSALKKLSTSERPEIIYLDPMFPERKKSALVKKEMRIFHDVVGEDDDAALLLESALTCATLRVVVKRPSFAQPIAGVAPSFCLKGSSGRFDIYLK